MFPPSLGSGGKADMELLSRLGVLIPRGRTSWGGTGCISRDVSGGGGGWGDLEELGWS